MSIRHFNVLRGADLDRTVSIEEIREALQDAESQVVDFVEADLEHWTDDSGVHEGQFLNAVQASVKEAMDLFLNDLATTAALRSATAA